MVSLHCEESFNQLKQPISTISSSFFLFVDEYEMDKICGNEIETRVTLMLAKKQKKK